MKLSCSGTSTADQTAPPAHFQHAPSRLTTPPALWVASGTTVTFHCQEPSLSIQMSRVWSWVSNPKRDGRHGSSSCTYQPTDDQELAVAVDVGFFSSEQAAAFRAEGERVIAEWPFPTGWEDWRADPSWPVPSVPAEWEAVRGS